MLAAYRWIPDIKTFREAAFTGWFGPMGVGAVFIATLAKTKLPEPHEDGPIGQAEILSATIQPIVFFLVLVSVLCRESYRVVNSIRAPADAQIRPQMDCLSPSSR